MSLACALYVILNQLDDFEFLESQACEWLKITNIINFNVSTNLNAQIKRTYNDEVVNLHSKGVDTFYAG